MRTPKGRKKPVVMHTFRMLVSDGFGDYWHHYEIEAPDTYSIESLMDVLRNKFKGAKGHG